VWPSSCFESCGNFTMPDFSELTLSLIRLGANPMLTQGSSGNASVKLGDTLWVTPSGKWLRDSGEDETFVPVSIEEALRGLAGGQDPAPTWCFRYPLRPSVEAWMHAVIPQRIVIHLHAINTLACSIRTDGTDIASALLEGLRWEWIPYTASGRPLATRILRTVQSRPEVFILANHGLIVAAESVEGAMSLVAEVECRLRTEPRALQPPAIEQLRQRIDVANWSPASNRVLHSLATDPLCIDRIMSGTLYPCHWIYGARHSAIVGADERASHAISRFHALLGREPSALLVPGQGTLIRADTDPEVLEQLAGLVEVTRRIPEDAAVRYLSRPELATIARDYRSVQSPHQRQPVAPLDAPAQGLESVMRPKEESPGRYARS
jgi:rhamnose utilization protein RhaD (predicted bifunctional aldolase and dehydrogenase)